MTKAIIRNSRIVKLTIEPDQGIEIGTLPKGVGLERLRWDGFQLIDLMDLDEFYVNKNTRKLYIDWNPNCDLVQMEYKDRNNLIVDIDTKQLRVKNQDELDQPKKDEYKARRRTEYPELGDQLDVIWKYLDTIPNKSKEVDDMINSINDVKERWIKSPSI